MTKRNVDAAVIVLVGHFNTHIVEPRWLANVKLISVTEADQASVDVVSDQVTSFSIGWAGIQVLQDKFIAEATDSAHYQHLQNLVLGTFRTLEHTPISMMGLIRRSHRSLGSVGDWHALGDRLGPKEPWAGILPGPPPRGVPGLRSIVMEGLRPESEAKWTRVKVEPSTRIEHGVYFEVHEEYDRRDVETNSASEVLNLLEESWNTFLTDASRMADKITGVVGE